MPADTTMTDLRPPTPTQLGVIRLVAEAKTNRQVGSALGMAEDTVKAHLRRLFKAWSVDTRIGLVQVAVQNGWIVCPSCGPNAAGTASTAVLRDASAALRNHAARLDAIATRITDGEAVPCG